MTFSRRHLLASLGLALPALTVAATEAKATTEAKPAATGKSGKKHAARHGGTTHAAHKKHKPASSQG